VLSWLPGWRKSGLPASASDKEEAARAEALQQILAKRSKLGVAQEAILTRDLAELAVADRAKVRQLEQRVLGMGGNPKPDDPVGDIIVCDDYNVNRSIGVSRPLVLAAAALTGLTAAGLIWYANKDAGSRPPDPAMPATAAKVHEWWEVKEIKQPDGTWKETGRVKLRARPDGTIEQVK